MQIADLLTPRSVIPQLRASSKKQLREIARRAATITGGSDGRSMRTR